MKKRIRVLIGVLLITFLLNGGETDTGSQKAANAAASPSGAYWTTYSNIPGPPASLKELSVNGPVYISRVSIGELSTGEELATVNFSKAETRGAASNQRDNSKYWVEKIQNAAGETVSVKVSSNAANDFAVTLYFNLAETDLPAYFHGLKSDDGVHRSDGSVISEPYHDPELPIAGSKELNFSGSYEDGSKIKNSLEEAGYETYSMRYSNGVYTFSTLKELVSRAKIEESVLKPKDWKTDKNKTEGNVGFYNKPGSFTGKISIDWTLSNIPFTIVINDARLDMLEDEEDRTSYTMSGTAEIKQKSFTITDNDGRNSVFKLKDKQQKRFSVEHAFQVSKTPKPGVSWDYVETWEYVEAQYNTPFLLTVGYTTRQSPTDFSFIPVSDLDKLDGSHTMTFTLPAFGGTATWSFQEEK